MKDKVFLLIDKDKNIYKPYSTLRLLCKNNGINFDMVKKVRLPFGVGSLMIIETEMDN